MRTVPVPAVKRRYFLPSNGFDGISLLAMELFAKYFTIVPRSASAPARSLILGRRLVAGGCASYVAVVAACPHPRLILRRDWDLKDTSHDHAVFEHAVVVLVPANWCALEDQRGHPGRRFAVFTQPPRLPRPPEARLACELGRGWSVSGSATRCCRLRKKVSLLAHDRLVARGASFSAYETRMIFLSSTSSFSYRHGCDRRGLSGRPRAGRRNIDSCNSQQSKSTPANQGPPSHGG